ncbi:MAG: SBBP repeat-containing protein [Bryobacteraceae bacterium]
MKAIVQITIFLWLFASALHAAGPIFSTILAGSGQEYATSVASDAQGNVYVAGLTYSPDFPVTTGAFQTKFGGTCDAFIAKVGPGGNVIWSTYLGGILDDWGTGVALDNAGNVLVTGWTRSANFPLLNPIQSTLDNGASDDFDAFVAKLTPDGSKLLYSTFLGGAADDGVAGIAVDSAGNAYVAVSSNSVTGFPGIQNAPDQGGIVVTKLAPQGTLAYSYFHPYGIPGGIALDAAGAIYVTGSNSPLNPSSATETFGPLGSGYAIAFKISPDGSKKIYETALGGSVLAGGAAIAVDSAGEAYVAGSTSSVDFPLVHPLQSSLGARPLWKSSDSGTTWTPLDNLPFALPQMLVTDPSASNTLYEATGDLGIFKSLDGGITWTQANTGVSNTNIQALAIDPVHPQTLYAAVNTTSASAVYKTVNGANTWTLIDSPTLTISQLAVDAQNPNIVWEIGTALRKSTDAGATWNAVAFPGSVQSMVLDPRVSGHLFAASAFVFCGPFCSSGQNAYLYRSVDGGANWIQIPSSVAPNPPLIVDGSTNPSTVYDGLSFRSVDGGVTWSPINLPPGLGAGVGNYTMAVDPSGTLYVAVLGQSNYVSHDHGQTWTALSSFIPPFAYEALGPSIASIIPVGSGTIYAATDQTSSGGIGINISQGATSGFVTKLSADGSSIVYSTYLRGHTSMESSVFYEAEPNVFQTQNWIGAIALDGAGNATVAGGTRAIDFPITMPAQASSAGLADAFAATISADGSKLNYATYFGGSGDDGALGATVDAQGDVIFAGQTWSSDFPNAGGLQLPFSYGNAFVVKVAPPGPPAISSVFNGASFLPGIEAGSWAMIQGTNLSNTYPGRTWTASEIVNGNLPTSLDGVSVSIDGKPAFVYYISPTQINVQAPSDSAVGAVNVVVTNNGAVSAAGTAQLQSFAPAFFMYSGTNYAIASLVPDYALLGNPSVIAGTVAAKPGDTVTLWGTGFGATNPPVLAGTTVAGAPAVVTAPTVTVGGVAAQVISTVLADGSAGLYQVTIQLPATVPTGAVAVQASVGGVQTQAGVLLFVATP